MARPERSLARPSCPCAVCVAATALALVAASSAYAEPKPRGQEFQVNEATADMQSLSSVCGKAGGSFVVVVTGYNVDSDGMGIGARRFDTAGSQLGTQFAVNSYATGHQLGARAAAGEQWRMLGGWLDDVVPDHQHRPQVQGCCRLGQCNGCEH